MKISSEKSLKPGFTLVELLVVIAIIATLAAAAFSIGPAAMNKARKLSAQNTATSVATAVNQFYTEYSALPDVGSGVKLSTVSGGKGVDLLNILAGEETTDPPQNARKIRFFSGKEAKGKASPRDGVVYGTGNTISGLFDPWGKPYFIELDSEYKETLEFTPSKNPKVTLRGRRVAVYSLGVENPNDAKPNTLVKSW